MEAKPKTKMNIKMKIKARGGRGWWGREEEIRMKTIKIQIFLFVTAFENEKEDDKLKSEYPNKCHVRDVTNSQKHPRIAVVEREKCRKFQRGFSGSSNSSDESRYLGKMEASGKSNQPENTLESSSADFDQYYGKKKKRKTEQEKLIASLNQKELTHVDGAFKRSTTIRYNNLNEDKLFDNLFDCRIGKPKRSSGKKLLCVGDVTGIGGSETDFIDFVEKDRKSLEMDEMEKGAEIKATVEIKKKRKTEKEKLIESLSAIERIHVDGAFKRNAVSINSFSYGNNNHDNNMNVSNNNANNDSDVSISKNGNVFSPVKFVGLEEDIESLIRDKITSDAT